MPKLLTYFIRRRESKETEHWYVDDTDDNATYTDGHNDQPILRPVVVNLRRRAEDRHS